MPYFAYTLNPLLMIVLPMIVLPIILGVGFGCEFLSGGSTRRAFRVW